MLGIDLMMHISMHPTDNGFFFKKRARKEKYELPEDEGKYLNRNAAERAAGAFGGTIRC